MLDKLRHTININCVIIITEVVVMENLFIKSLHMIKVLGIKNQEQYRSLQKDFLVLTLDSLKYISQKKDFKEIIKMAEEI